jgi:hypothetical protein
MAKAKTSRTTTPTTPKTTVDQALAVAEKAAAERDRLQQRQLGDEALRLWQEAGRQVRLELLEGLDR